MTTKSIEILSETNRNHVDHNTFVKNTLITRTFIANYKPYYIDEFCIDDKFKSVLRTLIEIDDINILISGIASSGKTSLLYAIIREYYGLAKYQSLPENNILFINSLKEQGINYYRNEMKTFCQSRCSIYGKKKMIIVDDLDMINEQCQQVFRNYIDKYKNNVHFVSACSNVQKVIESIQSRIHILRVEPATLPQIRKIMQHIIADKQLAISTDAQEYLLAFSNHSIRELINHLEKIYLLDYTDQTNYENRQLHQVEYINVGDITSDPLINSLSLEMCKKMCSNISFQQFELYVDLLKKRKLTDAIHVLYEIHDYGYSVIDILDYFYTFVKTTLLLNEREKYLIIPYLCKYITNFHSIHEDVVELALFSHEVIYIFIHI